MIHPHLHLGCLHKNSFAISSNGVHLSIELHLLVYHSTPLLPNHKRWNLLYIFVGIPQKITLLLNDC